MIPVMVARDSVTAEQGILVTSSSSSFFPFLFFVDFPSRFHSDQALHSPHTYDTTVSYRYWGTSSRCRPQDYRASVKKWITKQITNHSERIGPNEKAFNSMTEFDNPIYEEETRKKKRTNIQRSTSFRMPDTPWYTLLSFSPTTTTLTARLSLEKSWEPTKEREPDSKWGWM